MIRSGDDILKVLRLLIAAEPLLIYGTDNEGNTALHHAIAEDSSASVIKLLVEEGNARLDARRTKGDGASVIMTCILRIRKAMRDDNQQSLESVRRRTVSMIEYIMRHGSTYFIAALHNKDTPAIGNSDDIDVKFDQVGNAQRSAYGTNIDCNLCC